MRLTKKFAIPITLAGLGLICFAAFIYCAFNDQTDWFEIKVTPSPIGKSKISDAINDVDHESHKNEVLESIDIDSLKKELGLESSQSRESEDRKSKNENNNL